MAARARARAPAAPPDGDEPSSAVEVLTGPILVCVMESLPISDVIGLARTCKGAGMRRARRERARLWMIAAAGARVV